MASHPDYHAYVHGIRFEDIVQRLSWCFKVVKDHRTDDQGRERHPNGYVAWGKNWAGETMRIDFDLIYRDGQDAIAVVTAMYVGERS